MKKFLVLFCLAVLLGLFSDCEKKEEKTSQNNKDEKLPFHGVIGQKTKAEEAKEKFETRTKKENEEIYHELEKRGY